MWSSEAVLVLYFPTAVWLDFQNTVPHKLKGALKKKKKVSNLCYSVGSSIIKTNLKIIKRNW